QTSPPTPCSPTTPRPPPPSDRAAFSFPLTSRRGEFQGVLTVHFRGPREPSDRELRWAALYARLAAHMIEQRRAEDALRGANDELAAAFDALEAEMERRRDLTRRLVTAQEDDRRLVSRDLHDSVGQLLAGLSLAFKAVETAGDLPPATSAKLS